MSIPNLLEFFTRAKAELVARGFDFAPVNDGEPSNVNAKRGAWAITALGAWLAHQAGHTGLGLVAKNAGQNHYSPFDGERYGVDAVMFSSGEGFDVVEKAETLNLPMWSRFEHDPPLESFRPAFDPRPALGLLGTEPQPEPDPEPEPPPVTDEHKELRMMLTTALVSLEELKAHVDLTNQILASLQMRHDPMPKLLDIEQRQKRRLVVELNMGRFLGTARGFATPEGQE